MKNNLNNKIDDDNQNKELKFVMRKKHTHTPLNNNNNDINQKKRQHKFHSLLMMDKKNQILKWQKIIITTGSDAINILV